MKFTPLSWVFGNKDLSNNLIASRQVKIKRFLELHKFASEIVIRLFAKIAQVITP
jgi:hypothetical protein